MWGCLAPRQRADRKRIVRQFLSLLDGVRGLCVISTGVLEEMERAPSAVAAALRPHLTSVDPVIYSIPEAVDDLAQAYIRGGVLPQRREADAVHVAAATYFGVDYLVSWNHQHMTRPTKRLQYEAVNQLNGYAKTPLICNPLEACNELRAR